MRKKLGIVAVACFAFALCFALVGCGGNNKAGFVGTWSIESGSDESFSESSVELMKSLGLDVTVVLNDDGTGELNLFGEATDLTWDASSASEGKMTFEDSEANLKLADGKLVMEDSSGTSITFAKADAAASEASASGEAASGEAADEASEAASDAAASDEAADEASSESSSAAAA